MQPVHQGQQLRYQALFGFTRGVRTLGRDRIDLVDEHDRRGSLGGFLKHFAQALFALAIGRTHDFRAIDGEEAGFAFVGHRAGEPRLAGAWRPMQQHPLGRIDPEPGEQFGIAQRQLDHFAQLLDRITHPANVVVVDVAARTAGFLELLAQFDLGVLVDVDDTLGYGSDHGQADLGQRESRSVEHPRDFGRHVTDLLLPGGGDEIASNQRTAEEVALERLPRSLQSHFALCGSEDHAAGGAALGLADQDMVA